MSESTAEIEWADPPKIRTGRPRMVSVETRNELMANPGRWAKVASNVTASTGTSWRKGNGGFYPKEDWELQNARLDQKERVDIYARYVGE